VDLVTTAVIEIPELSLDLGVDSKVYAPNMGLKVSEIAKRAGVSPDSIRYYEGLGLLPLADRTAAGYRQFGEDAVKRIHFIKDAQSLGLKLDEIGELLKIQDDGACPCGHTKSLLERRLDQVNRELEVLNNLKVELERLSAQECFSPAGSSVWPCEIELRRGGDTNERS
jgi:DNA-binding transcriptional MerR regulator